MLESLQRLSDKGYSIALDDFELNDNTLPLLEYADIVKLDVLALPAKSLREHVKILKAKNKLLLAEKIETPEMYDLCKLLGFDMFQGYFLSRPKTLRGKKLSSNKIAVVSLLSVLNDPKSEIDDIKKVIAQDPVLCFKLLKLVNSAAFSRAAKIESLQQAITMLGLPYIRNWAAMLTLTKLDDKPHELCVTAMVRAQMCQLIALTMASKLESANYFIVGLLSTIDAFLDMPLLKILEQLNLDDSLSLALTEHKGNHGKLLEVVIHYERAEWDAIDWDFLAEHGVFESELSAFYVSALNWVSATLNNVLH